MDDEFLSGKTDSEVTDIKQFQVLNSHLASKRSLLHNKIEHEEIDYERDYLHCTWGHFRRISGKICEPSRY